MALINLQKTDDGQCILSIGVDPETFQRELQKTYQRQFRKIEVPGFRKGKASRTIIEKRFGEKYFYEDTIERLAPEELDQAVRQAGITPIGSPDFDFKTVSHKEGLLLEVKYKLRPEVDIEDYMGIAIDKIKVVVSDEYVEQEIKEKLAWASRKVNVDDRPVQNDDVVTADIAGAVDGEALESLSEKDCVIPSDNNIYDNIIPDFREQLTGRRLDEEFEITSTVPQDFFDENAAGKDAVFTVTIRKIEFIETPELDDEFAKDVSEFDTLEELRADIREKERVRLEKESEDKVNGLVIRRLAEQVTLEIPEEMVNEYAQELSRSYLNQLFRRNIDVNEFNEETMQSLYEYHRPVALLYCQMELAYEAVARREGLTVSEQEMEQWYQDHAGKDGETDIEKLKKERLEAEIRLELLREKARQLVRDNAVITEVSQEEYERLHPEPVAGEGEDEDNDDNDFDGDNENGDNEDGDNEDGDNAPAEPDEH